MKAEMRSHRKFTRLRRLLALPEPYVIGHLELLWMHGYQTGDPVIGNAADVETAVQWQGEAGAFTAAAVESGFVEENEDGDYAIHDLYDHAPQYVQKRMVRRGTAPPGRLASAAKRDREGEGESEGVRRRSTKPPATPPPPSEPVVMEIPCVGTGPQSWPLVPSKLSEWSRSYPGVDVLGEVRKAVQWLTDNPTRRKTYQGMPKFLSSWLSRTQDRARVVQNGPVLFPTKAERAVDEMVKQFDSVYGGQ